MMFFQTKKSIGERVNVKCSHGSVWAHITEVALVFTSYTHDLRGSLFEVSQTVNILVVYTLICIYPSVLLFAIRNKTKKHIEHIFASL